MSKQDKSEEESTEICSNEELRVKRKRKRFTYPETDEYVWFRISEVPDDLVDEFLETSRTFFDSVQKEKTFIQEHGEREMKITKFNSSEVKARLTPEEKRKRAKIYRDFYENTPERMEQKKKQKNDPILIQKAKEYNKRPDVIEKKKRSATVARIQRRLLKEKNRDFFEQLKQEAEKALLTK